MNRRRRTGYAKRASRRSSIQDTQRKGTKVLQGADLSGPKRHERQASSWNVLVLGPDSPTPDGLADLAVTLL